MWSLLGKLFFFLKKDKGVNGVYVDWQDPSMRHETNAQTAENLKEWTVTRQELLS